MMGVLSTAADLLDPDARTGTPGWRCNRSDCDGSPHDEWTYEHARSEQNPPDDDWYLWFILAGRGWGKTRTGAEWLADQMEQQPEYNYAIIAPTFDDGRDTCVEGESGLKSVFEARGYVEGTDFTWNRSLGQFSISIAGVRCQCDLFTAEKPDAARGPNLRAVWGDEPATWRYGQATWDTLQFAIRKGDVRFLLTGTPRPTPFVKGLMAEADHITKGTSYENRRNLSPKYWTRVIKKFIGTRFGRQEIDAEILEDVEGALWSLGQIEVDRKRPPMVLEDGEPALLLVRIVVAIDPAAESTSKSDETGIVVVGLDAQGHIYVLEDLSGRYTPERWAQIALNAYDEWEADSIVAEVNNGGDMVRAVIQALRPRQPVDKVRASRGKRTRAEPVSLLYSQHVVHHAEPFPTLEDQMTTWVPDTGMPSPDRMDALVWGVHALVLMPRRRTLQHEAA